MKNGFRADYTHVVEFKVMNPMPRMNKEREPYFVIKGELIDVADGPVNVSDRILVKDVSMTIIDWYIPPE